MTTQPAGWRLGYRPELDGVRGVAVLMVIGGHLNLAGLDSGGLTGVTLFFGLSGFLITSLLLEERRTTGRLSLAAFYARRALRLLPALALFLLVTSVVRTVNGDEHVLRDSGLIAFYSANWYRSFTGYEFGPLAHMWSLSVEEQFYVIWPLLLLALLSVTRGDWRWLVGVIGVGAAGSMVLRLLLWDDGAGIHRVYVGTDTRADALLVGAMLGVILVAGVRLRHLAWFGAAGALTAFATAALPDSHPEADRILIGLALLPLASIALIAYALEGDPILRQPALRYVGRISYGVYLWHFPLVPATDAFDFWPRAAIVAFGAIALASASYFAVEQPFLRLKRYFARPEPGADKRPLAAVVQPSIDLTR